MTDHRQEAFLQDLQALFDKHNAELDITDDGRPWGMHSPVAIVSMSHDDKPYLEFNLPPYILPSRSQPND